MSYPSQLQGIQGIGGLGGGLGLEMMAMMEMLMGVLLLVESEAQQGANGQQAGQQPGYGSGIPGYGVQGPQFNPLTGNTPFGGSPTQSNPFQDQATFSPLAQNGAQNGIAFQNGVPVVTDQNKSQAILDYLQNHASFSSPQDVQDLTGSLNQLSSGQLNLLFQQGTTYNFNNTDPTFQQSPNTLGYEESLNSNGQRQNPQIVINENFVQQNQNNPLAVQQDILHETTHALDSGVAAYLGLPTEMSSTLDPTAQSALQNYAALQSQGLVTWDNTATDPHGIYPVISQEPPASDLLGDAGAQFLTGNGGQLAQQDPQTYQALMDLLGNANNVGNQIVGL